MRAVIQRVKIAKVVVEGRPVGEIGKGILLFLGVEKGDEDKDIEFIASKVANLRIFEDDEMKMNLSVKGVQGKVLAVSQFTLLGDSRKGRRPSFDKAAAPKEAEEKYLKVVDKLKDEGIEVETGRFKACMDVELVNDGPVTILLDSRKGS